MKIACILAVMVLGVAIALVADPVHAQPSGKLVLYTSQPDRDAQQTVDGFRKHNPQVEVEIFRKQLDANGLYKIWPQKPLTPGEYAVVENTPGKLNMQIWDFTWEPGAKYVPDARPDTPETKRH